MRRYSLPLARLAVATIFGSAAGFPALAAINAGSAGDVCSPTDDPCIVSEEIAIANESLLDFGHRTLRIENGGVLDFGSGAATVRCGKLEVDVDGDAAAIRVSGTGDPAPGTGRRIEVVRQCSHGPRYCFAENDCDLGVCDVRRCEGDPDTRCLYDSGCNLGDCTDEGRCQFDWTRSCDTGADCRIGPCGTQLSCRGSTGTVYLYNGNQTPFACSDNADCELGDCSIGDGGIDLDGSTQLALAYPDEFWIRSASDITIRRAVEITGTEGQVNFLSGLGSIALTGPVHGSGQRGAFLFFKSGSDLTIDAPIGVHGDKAGGQVGLFADRDLVVRDDVRAETLDQRRNGGQVILRAGQDLRVETGTEQNPIDIHGGFAQAHVPGTRDSGRGGWVNADAGRDLVIHAHSRLRTEGQSILLGLMGGRDAVLEGDATAIAYGEGNRAPRFWILSGRDVRLTENATVEIRGEEGAEAGALWIEAPRDAEVDAHLRFSGAADSTPDSDLPPIVQVNGCMVRIGVGADLLNTAEGSRNRIIARGGLEIEDGASWTCDGCPNVTRVRDDSNPLVLEGNVDPQMTVTVDSKLDPCPNCIDPVSGNREFCDDGIECTEDLCNSGICDALPDDSACTDHLFCDGAATCDVEEGCLPGTPVDCAYLDDGCLVGTCDEASDTCVALLVDGTSCDDQDACTLLDSCTGDVCKGRRNVECGDCGSATVEWGEGCDDGDEEFSFGDACAADCQWIACGNPNGSPESDPTAADALYTLRSAVGLADCALSVCDANWSNDIDASDALLILRAAVGLDAVTCPPAVAQALRIRVAGPRPNKFPLFPEHRMSISSEKRLNPWAAIA